MIPLLPSREPSGKQVQQALGQAFRVDRAAVLATVARRLRDLHLAEDAVQDAYASAAQHWPHKGVPDRPRSMVDHHRVAQGARHFAT